MVADRASNEVTLTSCGASGASVYTGMSHEIKRRNRG